MRRIEVGRVVPALLAALALAGCADELESASPEEQGEPAAAEQQQSGREETQSQAARLKAPKPVKVSGTGQRVVPVRVARDTPLVVEGAHRGSSNFIVDLVSRDAEFPANLFNEIGNYSGETAVPDATAGKYRLKVDADGPWTLVLRQPVPSSSARKLPGSISGNGARVIQVRASKELQPIVKATHRGSSNFIVDLVGLIDTSGQVNVYNEIGNFSGETLVESMPEGHYLLVVLADGRWTLRFME